MPSRLSSIWKAAKTFLLFGTFILFSVREFREWTTGYTPDAAWSSVDVVTTVLAGVSSILTAMTVFLAVAALYGYSQIKDFVSQRIDEARRDSEQIAPAAPSSSAEVEENGLEPGFGQRRAPRIPPATEVAADAHSSVVRARAGRRWRNS